MELVQTRELLDIIKRLNIRLIYVFGSMARGDMRPDSDVDVAFLSAARLSLADRMELTDVLKAALKTTRELDLVDLRSAPPLLRHFVILEGEKLFGDQLDDDKFYLSAVKGYIDSKPLFAATKQYVQEHAHL